MNASGLIVGGGRPDFPWNLEHTKTAGNLQLWPTNRPLPTLYNVDMAWHHMIPWEALSKGWNGLVNGGRWDVLEAWLRLAGDTDARTHVQAMKQGQLSPEVSDNLEERLCWARWNLVEGPEGKYRTDDPGSDDMDLFASINVSSKLRNRCYQLQPIYNRVRPWNPGVPASASDAALLLGDFQKLQGSSNTEIPMFDPKVWTIVEKGEFNRFGQVVGDNHPKWAKAV